MLRVTGIEPSVRSTASRESRVRASDDVCYFTELGAGSGNRTRVFSLEGCCTTIVLYPRLSILSVPQDFRNCGPQKTWWRRLDSNQRRHSQRIYSPPPLATRALLLIAARRLHRTNEIAPQKAPRGRSQVMVTPSRHVNAFDAALFTVSHQHRCACAHSRPLSRPSRPFRGVLQARTLVTDAR